MYSIYDSLFFPLKCFQNDGKVQYMEKVFKHDSGAGIT